MRFNVPAYGTWVLSDYITAGKQPACFHYATLVRTKAHTFGTFRHPDPNSTGCLDPEARNRPDHSGSIAFGWPLRGNIWPPSHASHRLTRTLTQLPRRSSFLRVAPPPKTPHQRGRWLMSPASKSRLLLSPPLKTPRQRGWRLMRPASKSRPLLSPPLKHLVKGVGDDGGAGSASKFAQGVEEGLLGAVEHAQVELDLMGEARVERLGTAVGG